METLAQENAVLSQNQPILPEQPKQNNFLVIILSVLLLLSVSIAGFFAYQTQILVKELTSMKATSTPVSIEELKSDPTADWKIYTNEKLSFKYPKTWQQQLQQPEPVLISLETDNKLRFFVTYHPSYSISEWLQDTQSGKIIGKKTIGSYTYTLVEGGLMLSSLEYLVENRGNGFVRFVVEPSSDKNEVEKVFDQVLSTFKFTDSGITNTDEISQVKALFESRYVSLGLDPTKVKINEINLLGNSINKYVISYLPSTDYAGGGVYALVGKQNGKWIMPESGDENYCSWIKDYVSDEATKSFMGPTCKF